VVKRAVDAVFGLWRRVLEEPQEEIVLRLSALLLLLHGAQSPTFELMFRLICLPMLFSRSLVRNPWLWTALACISAATTYANWFGQDNHKFLITYWTIACCLSVWSRDTARALALNGRLLVALAFSFALFWKFFGGELLSGKFFELTFLTDTRFETVALMGGVPREDLAHNYDARRLLQMFPSEQTAATLESSSRLPLMAVVMAWLTVLIEGAVAATFWLRFRIADLDIHNWLLMAFCITTYSLAPVLGFGFVLVTMGLAQCNLEQRDSRQGYLWTFLIVQFAMLHAVGAAGTLLDL
jgi:hypothetical protein